MDLIIETFLEEALIGGVSIIATIVAAAGTFFVRWINARTKNEKLTQYTELLVHYVQVAVNKVAQTQADGLKRMAADGKLTDDEKEQLKESAIAEIMAIAPDAILKFQSKMNSDLKSLLDALIESAVHTNKVVTPPGE